MDKLGGSGGRARAEMADSPDSPDENEDRSTVTVTTRGSSGFFEDESVLRAWGASSTPTSSPSNQVISYWTVPVSSPEASPVSAVNSTITTRALPPSPPRQVVQAIQNKKMDATPHFNPQLQAQAAKSMELRNRLRPWGSLSSVRSSSQQPPDVDGNPRLDGYLRDRGQGQNHNRDNDEVEGGENRPMHERGSGSTKELGKAVRKLEKTVNQVKTEVGKLKGQHTQYDKVLLDQQTDLQDHAGHLIKLHKANDEKTRQLGKAQERLRKLKRRIPRTPKEGYRCERCFTILSTKQSRRRHMQNLRICPKIFEISSDSEDD